MGLARDCVEAPIGRFNYQQDKLDLKQRWCICDGKRSSLGRHRTSATFVNEAIKSVALLDQNGSRAGRISLTFL